METSLRFYLLIENEILILLCFLAHFLLSHYGFEVVVVVVLNAAVVVVAVAVANFVAPLCALSAQPNVAVFRPF